MLKNWIKSNQVMLVHLLVIVLFSLIPFLWLKDGQAILGHDAGFPLSPWEHFLDRVFLWTHRYGLGNDQTTEVGGFFIHGFEGVVDWLGFSLTNVQRITFSFYFLGFGVSMYFLAREMFEQRKRYLPLLAAIFYMINHFILQAWFIAERTKFTLYIALPIVLMLILKLYKKKLTILEASILAGLTIFFLNGGGFFPLFAGFLITIPYFLLLLIVFSPDKVQTVKKLGLFCLGWVFFTITLNAYWIIPYVRFTLTSFAAELETAGGASGVIAWVKTISENSSFYNLLRLQGIQEWYVNKLHPYAATMLTNSFFYLASYLWPLLAFSSFLFVKSKAEKQLIIGLIGLALLGIFFMAGSHPPFGFIYLWMISHIPGFVIFRTPYYKFAPALFLAFALLMAYTLDVHLQKIKKTVIGLFLTALIILGWSVFHFPFFTANFFDYEVGQKSTKVTVPNYVFEYADWANSDEFKYQRLLLLPGQNSNTHFEAYNWGYWSLAQIQGLLNNQSYIGNSPYKSVSEEVFIRNLYQLIEKNDQTWVDQAQYLFVDAVLLRKDFAYDLEGSQTTNPAEIESLLDNDPRFKKVKTFDQWIVYELASNHQSFAFKDYFYEVHVQDKENFFQTITLPGLDLDNNTVLLEENIPGFEDRKKGEVYIPKCIHCLLEDPKLYPIDRNQIITSTSIFYPYAKKSDQSLIENSTNTQDKLQLSSQIISKHIFRIQAQFARMAEVEDRLKGWSELLDSLATQDSLLDKYMSQVAEFSSEDNKFLTLIYENTNHQLEELNANIKEVNQENEAQMYLQAIAYLEKFHAKVSEELWYSEISTSKKFIFEANEAGNYDLYVKTDSLNSLALDQVEIPITINDSATSTVINKTSSTQNENIWTKLTTVALKSGSNRLQIEDPKQTKYFDNTEPIVLDFTNQEQCQNMDLGYLEKGKYKISFEANSDRDINDLYTYIAKMDQESILLPYWGKKLEIKQNIVTFSSFFHEYEEPGEYQIRFCRLNSEDLPARTLVIKNAQYEVLNDTLVALVKPNQLAPQPTSTLNLEIIKNNQTSYDINIDGVGKSLLMFDQRFDPGWQISPDQDIFKTHQRVHGYANGWLVEKNSADVTAVNLLYVSQKLYKWGWLVSFISLGCCLTILVITFLKKKA